MEKIRLQKLIAQSGVCSRRKAEEYIKAGKVKVNGRAVKLGDGATVKDIITLNGERIVIEKNQKYLYLALNKPRGYVTSMSDELGRKCVTELLTNITERVYPIGRLDKNSEGLLLFTNDGDFANAVMHPRGKITKTYRVTVRPDITDEQLIKLSVGVEIDGKKTLPASVNVLNKEVGRVVLQISIKEGRNRQVRKMCEAVGLEVARLRRTSIGPLKLGMLKPGAYRELTAEELRAIRTALSRSKSLD